MDSEIIAIFISVGLPASLGLIGYLVRSFRASRMAERERRAELLVRLRQLSSLLNSSLSVFQAQNKQRNRLNDMLKERDSNQAAGFVGFEARFAGMYDSFTAEERQLHGIIRAMTEESVGPLNGSMSAWLAEDSTFKYGLFPLRDSLRLSVYLNQMELHLLLWHAKFKYWMADEKHSLVYMADEKRHGTGFPSGIDGIVDAALTELGEPTSTEAQRILNEKSG